MLQLAQGFVKQRLADVPLPQGADGLSKRQAHGCGCGSGTHRGHTRYSSSLVAEALHGYVSGTAADSENTLAFAELSGVRAMIETYPLEEAAEAYARMLSGKAEFRVVLTMSH
jgi:D-arabinose 1-dehydrogenase-like Zn-dependent alcohol dehydrogenase